MDPKERHDPLNATSPKKSAAENSVCKDSSAPSLALLPPSREEHAVSTYYRFQCACYSNGTRPSAVVGTVCSCVCSAGQYNGRTRKLALGRNHTTLVHFNPVIATQGGPENKGKLLCMPQYKTMTAETALSMCACGGTATVPPVHACSRVLSCIQLSCALYCWKVNGSTRHCRV